MARIFEGETGRLSCQLPVDLIERLQARAREERLLLPQLLQRLLETSLEPPAKRRARSVRDEGEQHILAPGAAKFVADDERGIFGTANPIGDQRDEVPSV